MKLNPAETVQISRGLLLAALEYIGSVGTAAIPFGKAAELVAGLQNAAKSAAVEPVDSAGEGT